MMMLESEHNAAGWTRELLGVFVISGYRHPAVYLNVTGKNCLPSWGPLTGAPGSINVYFTRVDRKP